MRTIRSVVQSAFVVAVLLGTAAVAQDADSSSRGVARLSLMSGDVSIRRGDSGDFVAAALNSPLVVQDRVLTGPKASAEVQFDWANIIRLAGDTEIRLSELENRRYQVQIAHGLTTFRVLRDSEADVDISTPQASVRPVKQGTFRILIRDDGETEVTVRSGEVDIYTPHGVEKLKAGKTMMVRGTASDPEFQVVAAAGEDDWDRWNKNRDRDLEHSASYQHVSRDVYGAEDLDQNGRWVNDPAYGEVWAPRVARDWAPYREGRWVWVDWYGWTWVSYDSWGWAPYHYGRWYQHASYGWCWYPGARQSRHYWSPGLVAFVGWGGGGAGVGFGNVGWIPLAPHEVYRPWYGRGIYNGYRSGGQVNNITVVNNVNITNVYRNSRVTNGVTTVDARGFSSGRSGRAFTGSSAEFQRASLVSGQVPVAPGRESLRMSDREVRQGSLPRTANQEGRFFSRRAPAAVDRVPFEQQRQGVDQATRRSQDPQSRQQGAASVDRGGRGPAVDSGSGGWRRAGEANGAQPNVSNGSAAPGARVDGYNERQRSNDGRGWRSFGSPSTPGAPAAGEVRGATAPSTATERVNRGNDGNRARPDSGNSAGAQPAGSSGDSRGGWRGFGDPGAAGASQRSNDSAQRPQRDTPRENGRPIENRPANQPQVERRSEAPPRVERREQPRSERQQDTPRRENFAQRNAVASPEPLRISPPIVRERSAPRSERQAPAPRTDKQNEGGGQSSRGDNGNRGRNR